MSIEEHVPQSTAASHNPTAVACLEQSLLDIIEGAHGAHHRAVPSACAALNVTLTGDGFGLVGPGPYLAMTAEHASNEAIAPDTTAFIHVHAGHVEVAATNFAGGVTRVDVDAVGLLKDSSTTAAVAEIATLPIPP